MEDEREMPWPKDWVHANDNLRYVGFEHGSASMEPDEFLRIFDETHSLAALKKEFPASRARLLEALEHFNRDPIGIIREQLRSGSSDTDLAKLHAVDANGSRKSDGRQIYRLDAADRRRKSQMKIFLRSLIGTTGI